MIVGCVSNTSYLIYMYIVIFGYNCVFCKFCSELKVNPHKIVTLIPN